MQRVIGIDLGGTSILGGLVNEKGEILKRKELSTGTAVGRDEVIRRIIQVIRGLLEGEVVEGIGIGSPGFIDSNEGKVLTIGGNIEGWAGTNIKERLSKEFPTYPIFVDNDANVAGICESWIGAGKDLNSFLMITLGTGVGGAIFTGKEGIWHGHNYEGAEFGHAILYPRGRICNCGQRGCVEQYISGSAIEREYLRLEGTENKGKDIFRESVTNPKSMDVVHRFTEDLATYLVTLKNIFDPQGIIIGGGVINSREFWWDEMVVKYKKLSNSPEGLIILPALYLNDAGIIGAAKLAFDTVK